ncbi:MAG: EscU/YscU/HrcU family type III secretion system export apparatus switch protein [Limnobacter sp.]|uniref:EscU/YscU/HrcU family type III secretion system export apparatus switch protein n=1 Tax=Limnobacter sp. TaxID=2003368 RepID=UPI0032ECD675
MSGEKTEEATEKKKQDSVKKGQVAISKDVQTLLKLFFFYAVFFSMIGDMGQRFERDFDALVASTFKRGSDLSEIIDLGINLFLYLSLPLVGVCLLVALLSSWMQTGLVYAPEAVLPSFKKMNFVQNIQGMFSKKSMIQLVLSVIKIIVLAFVSWKVIQMYSTEIILSYRGGVDALLSLMVYLLKVVVFVSLSVFIVLSFTDWIAVFFDHKKNIRMSKNEVTDEYKQLQGDPYMKAMRQAQHRNLINSSLNRVSEAKVVVANPTHISVALDYEPGRRDLPFILAMGTDEDAMLIRKEADKHGIPIIRSVQLARQLYAECDEQEYIKEQHLRMAAEVFKIVMGMPVKSQTLSGEPPHS